LETNGLEVQYEEDRDDEDRDPRSGERRRVGMKELDWVSYVTRTTSSTASTRSISTTPSALPTVYDILLASDCIYNPFLIIPFLSTIAHFAKPNHTVVLVAMELREVSVTEEFLALWLEETERGSWEIWRVRDFEFDGGSSHVLWAAWRTR
jgi:hypothetical protein